MTIYLNFSGLARIDLGKEDWRNIYMTSGGIVALGTSFLFLRRGIGTYSSRMAGIFAPI
jgi:hypothetical protein